MPDKTDPTKADPTTAVDVGGTTDEVLREAGLRALQAEREAVKELKNKNKALQDQIDAEETKKLSEADKWKKKFEDATAKVATYEQKAEVEKLRAIVAEEAKIPQFAHLLAGADEAELKAHAAQLAEALGPQKPQPNPFLADGQNADGDGEQNARAILGF